MRIDEINLKTPIGKIVDTLREAETKAKSDALEMERLRYDLSLARRDRDNDVVETLVERVEALVGSTSADDSLEIHNLRMAAHDVRKEIG
jgi:hypothetical protein